MYFNWIIDDIIFINLYLYICIRVSANQGTFRNVRKYPKTGTVHHNPGMYI